MSRFSPRSLRSWHAIVLVLAGLAPVVPLTSGFLKGQLPARHRIPPTLCSGQE